MRKFAWPLAILLTVGCEGAADIDDDTDNFDAAPDIAGEYIAAIESAEGDCDSAALEDWASGPLAITGEADALTFDFGDGASFSGSVDSSFFFELGDSVTVGSLTLDVFADGLATEVEGGWQLEGEITANDSGGCSRSGTLTATQGTR